MHIRNTLISELPLVEAIYAEARAYQLLQSGYSWPVFERAFIENEILENRHYVLDDGQGVLAAVFSIVWKEPEIWNDTKGNEAIYLHRMVICNQYRGQQLTRKIIDWAIVMAQQLHKKFVRVDTWAQNKQLTNYYQRLGFQWVGRRKLPPQSHLPKHYNNIEVNLFQIVV
jgi:Acetyltransferases